MTNVVLCLCIILFLSPKHRAVVFAVDSAAFQNELKEVAEFLYTLLSDRIFVHNKLTVLIACNKQDVTMAKSGKIIQEKLEKEM